MWFLCVYVEGDVCHLAWLGSNAALSVTHSDRFWWGTVDPLKLQMTQTAWLGKPAALPQPRITRHFLPLLNLVPSPLCVSFPVLSITAQLWIPFVSRSTILLSVYSIALQCFFFLCLCHITLFFLMGLCSARMGSARAVLAGATWVASTIVPHDL